MSRKNYLQIMRDNPGLAARLEKVRTLASQVRSSEYHITRECNIRCKGCWYFEYGFDQRTNDVESTKALEGFVIAQKEKGITAPLLIGGEPALYPERVATFVKHMPYVSISSNGLKKMPTQGFENVTVAISLFGGGPLDDELRARGPNGKAFSGLFDKALKNYHNDPRACFVYALTEEGVNYIEPTVRRIQDNGNRVLFNYYSNHGSSHPTQAREKEQRLLDEALRVRDAFSETVISHPYFIRTLIFGETDWGKFSYETCPSISVDYAGHERRFKNGNPTLPKFNTYASDMKTVEFCCTSGKCESCRDSQAVSSWLMVSFKHFLNSKESLETWIELAESYWSSFIWARPNWLASEAPRSQHKEARQENPVGGPAQN